MKQKNENPAYLLGKEDFKKGLSFSDNPFPPIEMIDRKWVDYDFWWSGWIQAEADENRGT